MPIKTICETCSKVIYKQRGLYETAKHHFCSRECFFKPIQARNPQLLSCGMNRMEIKLKTPKGVFFPLREKPRNFIAWKGWHIEQSIQMSIKNSTKIIQITALRTINTIYELSRVVTVCFIKKELLWNLISREGK